MHINHPIYIPEKSKQELARRINAAAAEVDFSRYGYEPNYTPALVERLRGFAYKDENITVTIDGAAMVSNKRKSAESWSGADLSVVTTISDSQGNILKKGTLAQSKMGTVEELRASDKREYRRLEEQIRDMKRLTRHPKVLEVSRNSGDVPTVVSATGVLAERELQHYPIGDWIAKRVLPTFDGDTDSDFVEKILDANLEGLRIAAFVSS